MNTRKTTILSTFMILAITLAACSQNPAVTATTLPTQSIQTETLQQETTPTTDSNSSIGSLSDYQSELESIYEKVNPSVVNIQVTSRKQVTFGNSSENPFSDVPGFEYFFGSPSTPNGQGTEQTTQSLGSGFVWNEEGYIVTNNHVVENADKIQVMFSDGTIASATLVGTDVNSDLAVIKLDDYTGELVPITTTDSTDVKVGQIAIAIGNPYGLENTMTLGIVSAIGRSLSTDLNTTGTSFTIPDIIQTDAPINPGNSGGVLVNDQGELIGVTSAIESSSGSSAGIGFAIPSNTVDRVIPELIKSGKVDYAYLGLTGTTLTPDLAAAMNMDDTLRGVLVVDVAANGPAEEAGLVGGDQQVTIDGQTSIVGGDILTAIDGQALTSMDDLISYLANYTIVGQTVNLTVIKDGSEKSLKATLIARPTSVEEVSTQETQPTQEPQNSSSSSAWMGVAVTTMTPAIASAMDLPEDQKGVLILEIVQDGPADMSGLIGGYTPVIINSKRVMIGGDVITAMDDQDVSSMDDLQKFLAEKQPGQQITLTFLRDGKEQKATLTLAEKPSN